MTGTTFYKLILHFVRQWLLTTAGDGMPPPIDLRSDLI